MKIPNQHKVFRSHIKRYPNLWFELYEHSIGVFGRDFNKTISCEYNYSTNVLSYRVDGIPVERSIFSKAYKERCKTNPNL